MKIPRIITSAPVTISSQLHNRPLEIHMSDIAPFASACCRNVVEGLKEENEDIKKKNEQLHKKNSILRTQLIEITGPEGYPVYATGDLKDGSWSKGNDNFWSC